LRLKLGWICCKDILECYQLSHRTWPISFIGIGECVPSRTKPIIVHVFSHSINEGILICGCDFGVGKSKRILLRQHYCSSLLEMPSWNTSWLTGGYFARPDPCCVDAPGCNRRESKILKTEREGRVLWQSEMTEIWEPRNCSPRVEFGSVKCPVPDSHRTITTF